MSHFHRSLQVHIWLSISCSATTLLFLTSRDPQAEGGTLKCIFSNGWTTFKCFTNVDNYFRMAGCEHSLLTPLPSAAVFLSPFHRHLFASPSTSSFQWSLIVHDLQQDEGATGVRPVTAAKIYIIYTTTVMETGLKTAALLKLSSVAIIVEWMDWWVDE